MWKFCYFISVKFDYVFKVVKSIVGESKTADLLGYAFGGEQYNVCFMLNCDGQMNSKN